MSQKTRCNKCSGSGKRICSECSGTGIKTELNPVYIPIFGFAMPDTKTCNKCGGTGIEKCTCSS